MNAKQTSLMPDIVPLQHWFECDRCNKPRPTAHIMIDDNRTHLTCLHCGYNYISIMGDEQDEHTIGGYAYLNVMQRVGRYEVCELLC